MKYPVNDVLSMAISIGAHMLKSGAEVWRVEDTVSRICSAYGCETSDVFSITSVVVASVQHESECMTQSRRFYSYVYNLKQLEDLNALSRRICKTTPAPKKVMEDMGDILENARLKRVQKLFGYSLGVFSFTMFWGGTLKDALASIIPASLLFAIDYFLNRGRINMLAYSLAASLIASLGAIGICTLGFSDGLDKILIGNVMVLIPGIGLTNGIRDLLCGDIVSGLLRLWEAVLIAIAVALGFALPIIITGG